MGQNSEFGIRKTDPDRHSEIESCCELPACIIRPPKCAAETAAPQLSPATSAWPLGCYRRVDVVAAAGCSRRVGGGRRSRSPGDCPPGISKVSNWRGINPRPTTAGPPGTAWARKLRTPWVRFFRIPNFVVPYQTAHCSSGFIGVPGSQPKAVAKAGRLDMVPSTLN